MGQCTLSETTGMPDGYQKFKVIECDDRAYGVPEFLGDVVSRDRRWLDRHPAILWAPTREELTILIDDYDPTPFRSEVVGECDGHDLVRHNGLVYGVPRSLGHVDLNLEEERWREGIISGDTCEEVGQGLRAAQAARAIEFAGWLPVFARFGNCGKHPLFAHTHSPPAGYRFVKSRPRLGGVNTSTFPGRMKLLRWLAALGRGLAAVWNPLASVARNAVRFGPAACASALSDAARLVRQARRQGGTFRSTLRFVHSRHFESQILLPRRTDLLFLTSVPYTYGQRPWVIEIEDSTTLFFPFLRNGKTSAVDPAAAPCFPMVKALLESANCRGIITHIRSTAEALPTLFRSEVIGRKTFYVPLGVRLPERWQTHDGDDETIDLLFTNSWHQNPQGFFLRGGLDVLEAFAVLRERYPQVRLTIRSRIPRLGHRHYRMLEEGWVRIIHRFLAPEEMEELQRRSHIYLLPAARIHIVSLLQALSYGQAVVVSDGWGIQEYVTHERNGLVVNGRAGKVSWMDERAGLLREDYEPMFRPDPTVVEGLVEAVSRLVEEKVFRRGLGRAARTDVETKYNLHEWNRGLKDAFDKARSGFASPKRGRQFFRQ